MKRIVVLPDIHTPNQHEPSIKSALQFIKFYKPDTLIQLGDFCDWDSVSSYDPSAEHEIQPIQYEVEEANALLDRIDKIVGKKCTRIMLGGNHEARYEKFRVNQGFLVGIRRIKALTSWHEEYGLDRRGWEHVEYGENVKIGKVVFTHGWASGSNSGLDMSRRFPGRNVIYGHTHQHIVYGCMDENQLPIECESIGTLSKFNLSYLNGKPPYNWINSFMYIDMNEDGTFSKHFVRVINGQFTEFGRLFKAC